MTPQQLKRVMPLAPAVADQLNAVMAEFDINTPLRQAAFLATLGAESTQLTVFSENLNYSAAALASKFKKYFTLEQANAYARQPERIANRAYANRNGNGDEASGDGWRYRGAGAIQLTFKNNHAACGTYFKVATANMPAWLRTTDGALRSAGWFWKTNNINKWADIGDFDGVSDKVNIGSKTAAEGDSNGWAHRLAFYNAWKKELL